MRVLMLLAVATAGCAVPAPSTTAREAAPGDSVAGTLRVVGSAPVSVRLVIQSPAGSATVGGPLAGELRALAGAEVTLAGRREGADFVASGYRVRSIDGRPVTLGTVEAADGDYLRVRTDGGDLVYLVSPPAEIRPGQKVWVQGPPAVIVQSFGTVRP